MLVREVKRLIGQTAKMKQTSVAPFCSLNLPAGWEVKQHGEYVELQMPALDTRLRITPFNDPTGRLDAQSWVFLVERVNRTRGRRVIARRCGDFTGFETPFESGEQWIRGWALVAGMQGLDVNYRCAAIDTGRDDDIVDALLSSLRLSTAR